MQDFLLNKMKIGRPRLKTAERKGKVTGVRFTPAERRLLERAASDSGQSLSQWMRAVLLETASVRANTNAVSAGQIDNAAPKQLAI